MLNTVLLFQVDIGTDDIKTALSITSQNLAEGAEINVDDRDTISEAAVAVIGVQGLLRLCRDQILCLFSSQQKTGPCIAKVLIIHCGRCFTIVNSRL